jgi:hypothetical protein
MYKKMAISTKAAASKTKSPKILKKETKNGQHGLINSLHKWGEDYYGAEDYYEKPVNNMPKKNYYSDFLKKSR